MLGKQAGVIFRETTVYVINLLLCSKRTTKVGTVFWHLRKRISEDETFLWRRCEYFFFQQSPWVGKNISLKYTKLKGNPNQYLNNNKEMCYIKIGNETNRTSQYEKL